MEKIKSTENKDDVGDGEEKFCNQKRFPKSVAENLWWKIQFRNESIKKR